MTAEPTMLALAQEYLAFRRILGFTLGSPGQELLLFARYADRTGHRGPVTIELAVRWAKTAPRATPAYWAWRLHAVRMFAQHRALEDPRTEVPPAGLLGPAFRRGQPHIYSAAEIGALLRAARTLRRRMRPHTCVALFGLLAATGLRVGEALALRREHVDLEAGVVTIVKSKACKSRLVPLHASTTAALRRYAAVRDRIHPVPRSSAFFLTDRGTALTYQRVTITFRTLRRQLGWPRPPRGAAPRVHDLRHTFAVRVLLRWYEAGANVDEKIAALATYLRHVNVTCTYWYLTAVPELMAATARRFERYAEQGGRR
jgi:integrase